MDAIEEAFRSLRECAAAKSKSERDVALEMALSALVIAEIFVRDIHIIAEAHKSLIEPEE